MTNEIEGRELTSVRRQQKEVERRFSARSKSYRDAARVQKEASDRLARSIDPWRESLPPGPVLEVGAGTGMFSKHLDRFFPNRELWITDLSEAMIYEASNELGFDFCDRPRRDFRVHNAESGWFDPGEARNLPKTKPLSIRPGPEESPQLAWERPGPWSLITGSFVAQWFRDPSDTLSRLATGLAPGGVLLMAMPGSDSFPEWKERCHQLNLQFTGNPLPDTERLVIQCSNGPFQVDYYEEPYKTTYESSLQFFQELRNVGATTTMSGAQLSPGEFRHLVRTWDASVTPAPVQVTWHLLFLAIRRDF
ncbi:MAG: methyltransferase domain-containing protein [Bacteroidota bacterium]